MTDPFDTGIRLTVVRDPTRVRCDVDEFVLCPSNARADEWKRQAEAEAWDHLVTRKQLVEVEVEVASLSAALGRANHLAWEARQERDAAVQRAAQAESDRLADVEGLTAERDHYRAALHACVTRSALAGPSGTVT